MLPKEFIEFLKTRSDMELVALQNEARDNFDKPTFRAVMLELKNRECAYDELCKQCIHPSCRNYGKIS
jgi:hypothetical protein